jgi:hypothetical protein
MISVSFDIDTDCAVKEVFVYGESPGSCPSRSTDMAGQQTCRVIHSSSGKVGLAFTRQRPEVVPQPLNGLEYGLPPRGLLVEWFPPNWPPRLLDGDDIPVGQPLVDECSGKTVQQQAAGGELCCCEGVSAGTTKRLQT